MTKWALLIGVNHVFESDDLPACKNDVRTMSCLLQQRFGFENQHILEMIVSQEDLTEANSGGIVSERAPTYDNIINAFRNLETLCCPGDLVYFHFSGTMIRARSHLPGYAEFPFFYTDFAFIPADYCNQHLERLLHDLELSALLFRLIQKGAEVIAMLDCRPDAESIEFPDLIGPRGIHFGRETVTSLDDLKDMSFVDVKWSQRMPDLWMFDPSPAEALSMIKNFDQNGVFTGKLAWFKEEGGWRTVYDLKDGSGMEHGMLTHWMTRALQDDNNNNNNSGITLRDLYRLMLEEAKSNDGIKVVSNRTSLVGNGLRLFPGSLRDKERRSPGPVPAPTSILSEPPRSYTKKEGIFSLQGTIKEQIQAQPPPPGTEPLDCLDFLSLAQLSSNYDILNFPSASLLSGSSSTVLGNHDQEYLNFLQFEGADQDSNPYVQVEIAGGYRYQDTVSSPYPDFDENGLFHALSGDHIVLLIRNHSNRDLFLRIIHFGCDGGVETIYPDVDLVENIPTFRQVSYCGTVVGQQQEVCLHFRVGLRSHLRGMSHLETQLCECFKVFVSDRPVSFKCMERLPTNAAEHPQMRPDFIKSALAENDFNGFEGLHEADYHFLNMAFAESSLNTESV